MTPRESCLLSESAPVAAGVGVDANTINAVYSAICHIDPPMTGLPECSASGEVFFPNDTAHTLSGQLTLLHKVC